MTKTQRVLAVIAVSLLALFGVAGLVGYLVLNSRSTSDWAMRQATAAVQIEDYEGALFYLSFVKGTPEMQLQADTSRALLLEKLGRDPEAIIVFKKVADQRKSGGDLNNYAWLLATTPDESLHQPAEAVRIAEMAYAKTKKAMILDTVAAAYADAGDFAKAVELQEKVVAEDPDVDGGKERLESYRKGKPFRLSAEDRKRM